MRIRTFHPLTHQQSIAALGVVVACILAGGCYHHVIRADGPGNDNVDVYEPNLKTPEEQFRQKSADAPNKTIPTKKAPGN